MVRVQLYIMRSMAILTSFPPAVSAGGGGGTHSYLDKGIRYNDKFRHTKIETLQNKDDQKYGGQKYPIGVQKK